MFDIGFSELLLFGIIALIVLGPEKLPQAARTAGQWYAKIRRTVSTLQSEIEAELDLAETRQQMQKELAKIRETEAQMRREMAELRGDMQEFESAQNRNLKGSSQDADSSEIDSRQNLDKNYAYGTDSVAAKDSESVTLEKSATQNENLDDALPNNTEFASPIMTRPWENMWFLLGDYDKSRRLPIAPYLPNYKADILWHAPEYQGAANR